MGMISAPSTVREAGKDILFRAILRRGVHPPFFPFLMIFFIFSEKDISPRFLQ